MLFVSHNIEYLIKSSNVQLCTSKMCFKMWVKKRENKVVFVIWSPRVLSESAETCKRPSVNVLYMNNILIYTRCAIAVGIFIYSYEQGRVAVPILSIFYLQLRQTSIKFELHKSYLYFLNNTQGYSVEGQLNYIQNT